MQGEMDPFFFLTKHKNFIPHEYPCRTVFAAERRGRRPQPASDFLAVRNWLPFAAPRQRTTVDTRWLPANSTRWRTRT